MTKIIKFDSTSKRVNVYNKEKGIIMRTTRSLAERLVAEGTHTYTSKGKLSSFLNKEAKLYRNMRAIQHIDFKRKGTHHRVFKDEESGKTYAAVAKLIRPVRYTHPTEINKTFTRDEAIYQYLVIAFPNH